MAKDISSNLQSGTKADFPAKARESLGAPESPGRRRFIAGLGAATVAVSTGVLAPIIAASSASAREPNGIPNPGPGSGNQRVTESFEFRFEAAIAEASVPVPAIPTTATKLAIRAASATTPRLCRTIVSAR